MNNLEIILEDQVSVDQLVAEQAKGVSVVRSAHVGNAAPYNLVLADAGIDFLLVDHTITGVDKNYFPEEILRKTGNVRIGELGKLSCCSEVQADYSQEGFSVERGTRLDLAHVKGLQALAPGARLQTNTDYIQANEKVSAEVVAIAAEAMPRIFKRLATSDGTVLDAPYAAELLQSKGLLQLNDDPKEGGVIVPLEVDIAINFVAEALRTDRTKQYHLSGPDMIIYLAGKDPTASKRVKRLVGLVRAQASFGDSIPDPIELRLVTTAEARFATTMQRAPQLQALLDVYQAREDYNAESAKERKLFFASSPSGEVRAGFETRTKAASKVIDQALAEASFEMPELFLEPRVPKQLSQYDALAEGGLFVPALTRQLTMAQLKRMYKEILKARSRYLS